MSVPRNKRTLSNLEYFHNGIKMRDMLLELMIRDFGVKIKKNDFEFLQKNYNMSEEDLQLVEYLCKKYHVYEHILYDFPVWFMEYERKYLMTSIRRFFVHLRYADAIIVTSDETHQQRKYHLLQARTECYLITDEMDYMAKVYPIDMNKYLPLLDVIHYEIKLLSHELKLDNDRYRKWKNRDTNEPFHQPVEEKIEIPPRF